MTAQTWIDETRDMLLSGYVEELLLVSAPEVTNCLLYTSDAADDLL